MGPAAGGKGWREGAGQPANMENFHDEKLARTDGRTERQTNDGTKFLPAAGKHTATRGGGGGRSTRARKILAAWKFLQDRVFFSSRRTSAQEAAREVRDEGNRSSSEFATYSRAT